MCNFFLRNAVEPFNVNEVIQVPFSQEKFVVDTYLWCPMDISWQTEKL